MNNKKRVAMGYVFLLPALILFMVVVAYPVFNTLKTSFYSIRVQNIATGGKWVGLANYKQLIQDPNTWVTLKFTLLFTVVSVILEIVIGMGCALIMNIGMRGEGIVRGCILVPWCIPTIVEKYHLALSPLAQKTLQLETPSEVPNVTNTIIGSVSKLCEYAKDVCTTLGYDVTILTDRLTCEAREAGMFLGSIALAHANTSEHLAFLAGGETVVHLMGKGLGGRNQEIALAAASQIEGIQNVAVFSFGSDGTDGPTDAAGGYVDGKTSRLVDIDAALKASDSYHALQKSGGLLVTGPTGTNVNDLAVVLIN